MNIIQYRVRLGDTLSKIALRYGVSVDELAKLNHIGNINILWVGQELNIPFGGAADGTLKADDGGPENQRVTNLVE